MDDQIAHVMQDITWYLNSSIVPSIIELYPNSKFYIFPGINRSVDASNKIFYEDNLSWVANLSKEKWGGVIYTVDWLRRLDWLWTPIRNRLCSILPSLSLRSWWNVLKGPKNFVFHGAFINLPTMLIFKLLRKRVAFINWAGPGAGRNIPKTLLERMKTLKWRLCSAVFVLMSPEIRYFVPFLDKNKIKVLPYPNKDSVFDKAIKSYKPVKPNKILIVGNNALRMRYYPKLLDQLCENDWEKIVCMLNYGSGGQWCQPYGAMKLDEFITKYKVKFGDSFCPWLETVSYGEYVETMEKASTYICPVPTQSGLGAAITSILQGKAVLLTGDNYKWFSDLGVKTTLLDTITDFSSAKLLLYVPSPEQCVKNICALKKAYSETYGEKYWVDTLKTTFQIRED